mmetsp:Transcript_4380/g.4945  ORF Transcript_4380/g.4945 Transcript_4380/m.4945 type:complete len:103 (+) Transcript_4380:44-352(+)
MGIFKRLFGGFGTKRKVRIVVVGLDNSGKTTVLNALKPKKASLETVPTVGFSTEEFQKHGVNLMSSFGHVVCKPFDCLFHTIAFQRVTGEHLPRPVGDPIQA